MINAYWIIKCEFPDDDQITYVVENTIMGKHPKKFASYDSAKSYAFENFPDCVYNIEEHTI